MKDYNNTYKVCELEISVEKSSNNGKTIVTRSAKINSDNDFNRFGITSINNFINDLKAVKKLYKKAIKDCVFVNINFYIATYKNLPGDRYDIETVRFDRWSYSGYPANDGFVEDDNKYYIYLRPDTRYTDENHDMAIRLDNMLEDLAEYTSYTEYAD